MSKGLGSFIQMILDFLRGLGGSDGVPEAESRSNVSDEGSTGEPEHETVLREVRLPPDDGGDIAEWEGELTPSDPGPGGDSEEGRKTMLKGKGVWAYREAELDHALQIASQMGATHVIYKVGQGAVYYPGRKQAAQKIKAAGLIPFAWTFVLLDDPQGEAQVVVQAFRDGYEGFVFDTEAEQCRNRFEQAVQLGQYLSVASTDPERLYNCSFPNISHHRDLPYDQMNEYCKGGLMPMAYGTYYLPESDVPPQQQAQRVIDEWTYGHYEYWCHRWGYRPPLYPVLGPYHDEHGQVRMSPQEFQVWLDLLAVHAPAFFSVFTANVINDDLLPLIKALPLGEPAERIPSGVKVEVMSLEVGYLNVRPTPSTQQPPIARVNHGQVVDTLEPVGDVMAKVGQEGQWLFIRTPGGVDGYVAAWYLRLYEEKKEPVESGLQVEVVSPIIGFLNVRPAPSTAQLPVARADDGEVLEALGSTEDVMAKVGQEGQWLHIRTPGGVEGYVAAWYLRLYEAVTGEAIPYLAVHSEAGLNVRSSAGTDQAPNWHVEDRTTLQVLEDPKHVEGKLGKDQWIKVRTPSLHEGYVNGLYVRAEGQPDSRKPVKDDALPAGECAWIFGIHAAEATAPANFRFLFEGKNKAGWVLFTEAFGAEPNHTGGHDFSPWSQNGYGVIVRLNNGYEPAGTLPVQAKYADFAKACARYVQNSQGCHIWIIGNEQNNPREHPGGAGNPIEHITPQRYAQAFNLARQRIKAVQPGAIVVPGAVDPYYGLPWKSGEVWRPLDYFKTMLAHIDDLDGICLHTYTHWLDVELITKKTVFTDAPLNPGTPNEHYYDFQSYRPFAEAIPAKWRDRPIYITESNHWIALERAPNPGEHVKNGWVNKDSGWVRAAYAEIDRWNQTPYAQQIHCFLLYRWTGDAWAIEGLGEVQNDFKKALDHDYRWRR